jgi:carbamoyl-phosphate synthase small subunit
MTDAEPRNAWLVLEDGAVVVGEHFGASGTAYGELVFHTGMTGYQESLTDPSYHGQVLMFTYPMVGNYGVNAQDWESDRVWPRAVVVREWCRAPSHRASERTLDEWLRDEGVPGITGVDTRALTLTTRAKGCLRCFVTDRADEVDALRAKIATMPSVEADNLAGEASVVAARRYGRNGAGALDSAPDGSAADASARTVAVIDTGIKRNILRNLVRRFNLVHLPWDASAADVLTCGREGGAPDGLFIANGPGDPGHPDIVARTVPTIRTASERLPTFGICYGNQLVSLAWGATTSKMKFGHRGANIPVREQGTSHVRITSQNHGFAVDADSIAGTQLKIWETCPNDGTVEGVMHQTLPVFTTQYHPEACPGPWDSGALFDAFAALIEDCKAGRFKPGKFASLHAKDTAPVQPVRPVEEAPPRA